MGRSSDEMVSIDGDPPEILPADQLDLGAPMRLACGPGDYGLPFTSPTRADGRAGSSSCCPFRFTLRAAKQLRGPQRPFWEVDVEVYPPRMPSGRGLRGSAMLADDGAYPMVVLRSGRDGISFSPQSMGFVPGGATLEQSVATPRLHVLGLRGWVEALAVQEQPDTKVQLSQAGRRAMILTRLWGSRSAVARDLLELNDFLREFQPSGSSDSDAYGDGDGVRLTAADGYLTAAAATRTLPGLKPGEIRDRLNHLLSINVLQRGLIVPCSECERRAFYRIELLGETNVCPRCGAPAYVTAARRSDQGEPEWFYDLHGAVRELLRQDGDVPFLAGKALAASARSFENIAELDFCRPDQKPAEIDIARSGGQSTHSRRSEVRSQPRHQQGNRPGYRETAGRQRPPRCRRDPARYHGAGAMEGEGGRPVAEGSSESQLAVRQDTAGPGPDGLAGGTSERAVEQDVTMSDEMARGVSMPPSLSRS